MATVTAPPHSPPPPPTPDVGLPPRLERLPSWLTMGGLLLVLLAVSAYVRTRYISGEFWMDEGITTGIASHSLSAIPGVLRHDGSPPLFYLLLHFWMQAFGASESATHALPLLFSMLTIPVAMWAGTSLIGRRAGVIAATLFAFSTFLTQYGQETRMYSLMGLLGLLATAAFMHAFVFRRRKYLILFAVCQALMLYTHAWGIFYGLGSMLALVPVWLSSDSSDRRGLVRDAAMAYVGAGVLFLPWLPNFIYQSTHTGAPWAPPPRFGAPVLISRDLFGGDRVAIGLLFASIIGFAPVLGRRYRRTPDATVLWILIVLPLATLAIAWLASQITPAFVSRYFAPVLAPLLLLAAFGMARAGIVGWVALALSIVFVVHISSYAPQYKSDVRDIGGEMTPLLHTGDLIISGQPEQVPLEWYYLPDGLRYGSTLGAVSDPRYMNWVFALRRLQKTQPAATLGSLLASLKVGQQVLFVRPLTEGAHNWQASWTQLVRRRAAQWGALLADDPQLKPVARAPHNYRGACCVADTAILYKKVS